MKTIAFFAALLLFASTVTAGIPARAAADEFTGKYTLVADAGGQVLTIALELKQEGDALTGATYSELGNGTIDGGKVTDKAFTAILHAQIGANTVDLKMDGRLEGDKITGSFTSPQFGNIPYTATRNK